MIEFKEKYKASRPWKKVAVFNTYSLGLAVLFFAISYFSEVLSNFIFGDPFSFKLLSRLISAIICGYIICFLALYTAFLNDKKKGKIQKTQMK